MGRVSIDSTDDIRLKCDDTNCDQLLGYLQIRGVSHATTLHSDLYANHPYYHF